MPAERPASWRLRVRARADALARGIAAWRGYDLVPRSPYSPLPTIPDASSPEWGPKHSLVGLEFDTAAQLEWLRRHLAPYLAELAGPVDRPADGSGFYLGNGYYSGTDAVVLHAMVRHLRPRRIIEVGAGFSTMVLAGACVRNAADGAPCELVSIDPEPRVGSAAELPGLSLRERRSAADVPLETFLDLEAGDILFVDSSHTVKRGSEVNFLVLEVLPRLRAGVFVHFHDVFLPYDYPREWFLRGTFLAEQYLVHAFLLGNPGYEVVLAVHAMVREHGEALRALVPWVPPSPSLPAALWLRRVA